MENFIFREARVKDLEEVLKLNSKLFKKERKEFDKSLDLNWTYGKGKKYFKDRILKRGGFVEVVENKGKIIGYLCGGITEKLFYRKKAKYAELENMFIEKQFRNKALGTRLTKDFLVWCRKDKVNYISVIAHTENKSVDFYRKFGFKDYNLTLEKEI